MNTRSDEDLNESSSSPDGVVFEKCGKHKDLVRNYCKVHQATVCSTCVLMDHKLCGTNIISIQDEFQHERRVITAIDDKTLKTCQHRHEELLEVHKTYKNTVDEIETSKENLIKKVESDALNCETRVSSFHQENASRFENNILELQAFSQQFAELTTEMSKCRVSQDSTRVVKWISNCRLFRHDSKTELEELQKNIYIEPYTFTPARMSGKVLEHSNVIGFVDKISKVKEPQEKQAGVQTRGLMSEFLRQVTETVCRIRGSGNDALLCCGHVVVSDKSKGQLCTLDIETDTFKHKIQLPESPACLILIGERLVALVLKKRTKITCYKINEDGSIHEHQSFSKSNEWVEILSIAERDNGKYILATVSCYDRLDFKHPTLQTKVEKLCVRHARNK